MQPTAGHSLWTAAAIVGALALPAAAAAQQPLAQVQVTGQATLADRLDARAATYEASGEQRRWGRAAGLRERAAGLRAPDDSTAFQSLRVAAALRYGIGEVARAGELLERAADQAIARGDVYNAARSYVDAAYAAAESRDGERVRRLSDRGTLLMHSPLLSGAQRDELRTRVAGATARALEVAAVTRP